MLAASGHLTGRDRYLVCLVGQHRVLTTGQLCALGFGNIITARHRLGVLVRIGVLRRFRPRREQAARRALAGCRDTVAVRIATAVLDPQVTCPAWRNGCRCGKPAPGRCG